MKWEEKAVGAEDIVRGQLSREMLSPAEAGTVGRLREELLREMSGGAGLETGRRLARR